MAQQVLIRWNTNRWNWRSKKRRPFIRLLFEKWTEPKIWHGTESCEYLMTRHVPLLWSVDYDNNQFICQQPTFSYPSQHFLEILSSLLPFIRNLAFIRRPNFCLATTDLLVGLVCQPLHAAYWMSVSYEHWNLCRFAYDTFFVSAYALYSVSLLTMTAISVDRLLALLLGLRYRELVTLKRTYILVATFWVLSGFTALSYPLDHRTIVPIHLTGLVHKDFPHAYSSSGSSTRSRPTAAEPTKRIEHGAVQEGSVQCRVGAVSISCLLCAI